MNNKILTYLAVALFLSGCTATIKNSGDYTPPVQKEIENEIRVDAGFEATWSKLVREMSKSFYIINNIDKESRLINISFSMSNNISDYLDCGVTKRTFDLADLSQNISYQTADKSEFYVPSTRAPIPAGTNYFKWFRIPTLEGRSNVYVAPDGQGTRISVNTRYVWDVNISETGYLYTPLSKSHTLIINRRPVAKSWPPISFNTNDVGGEGGVSCVSTGKFENEILDIVR